MMPRDIAAVLVAVGLIWVGFAVAVGVAAHHRGRSAVLYFLTSILFSPVLAIILLAISGGLKTTPRSNEPTNPFDAGRDRR